MHGVIQRRAFCTSVLSLNIVSLLQSAALRTSLVEMSALAAAVTAAPLIECVLNNITLISMPAFSINDLSHLATVDGATGLCGLTTPKKILIEHRFS